MDKKKLYENIMTNVAKHVKNVLNEGELNNDNPIYVKDLIKYLNEVLVEYGNIPVMTYSKYDYEYSNDDFNDFSELAPFYDVRGDEELPVLVIQNKDEY